MKQSVNFTDFIDAFNAHDRLRTPTKSGNFDYDGLRILWDYLEELESDIGEEIELDVIALCCEYQQDSFVDVARDYQIDIEDCEDSEEIMETVLDYLNEHTQVCGHDDDFVVFALF